MDQKEIERRATLPTSGVCDQAERHLNGSCDPCSRLELNMMRTEAGGKMFCTATSGGWQCFRSNFEQRTDLAYRTDLAHGTRWIFLCTNTNFERLAARVKSGKVQTEDLDAGQMGKWVTSVTE